MPFCVEVFNNPGWKIIRNTIRPSKEGAEKEKLNLETWLGTEGDRLIPVKERFRVKKLKEKEAKALMEKKHD